MHGLIRWAIVIGLPIGCHTDDTVTPDAPTEEAGLVVEWSSQPTPVPGDLGDGVTLERARFAFDSLRVIGDAGPGDPRTTASGFEVRWDDTSRPEAILFTEAPTGLYSQVSLQIDGHLVDDSYELRGRVFLNGTDWEYRIEDKNPLGLTVQIDETLIPGDQAIVRLRINFKHAIDAIDFELLDIDEGRLELDESDTQMPGFRQKLVESFEIINAGARLGTDD